MRLNLLLGVAGLWLGLSAISGLGAVQGGFHLDRLPKGKNVTIPRPATTYVPLTSTVVLTATDMPQSVSFKPVNLKNGPTSALKLKIFDRGSSRVQYVDVSPTTPFLYAFKTLGPITVIVEDGPRQGHPIDGAVLQVESNKPLDIAH